jgi:8-oxo-dGTP pyrophosphatase MutT (NUDIX family)
MGRFCFLCEASGVIPVLDGQGFERFRCPRGHVEERCYLFDGRAVFALEEGRLVHESVGALVVREGRLLLFERCKYPPGWTIPAGHLEAGMDPQEEMRREVAEEVGLVVTSSRRIWDGPPRLLADRCRRGADWHRWHLFLAEATGEPRLGDEGSRLGWFTLAEALALDLIAPARTILSEPHLGRAVVL